MRLNYYYWSVNKTLEQLCTYAILNGRILIFSGHFEASKGMTSQLGTTQSQMKGESHALIFMMDPETDRNVETDFLEGNSHCGAEA